MKRPRRGLYVGESECHRPKGEFESEKEDCFKVSVETTVHMLSIFAGIFLSDWVQAKKFTLVFW